MEDTKLMRHIAEHFADRFRIERGAIGGDAFEGQVAIIQSRFQTLKKRFDILMMGIMIDTSSITRLYCRLSTAESTQ